MRRRALIALLAALPLPALPTAALAHPRRDGLIEPTLRIASGGAAGARVALTLDACMGEADHRILDALIAHAIPATLFVTGRWLARNAATLTLLQSHPDLFQLENHGAMHVPAVLGTERLYGIAPAGSLTAVTAEVEGGARAMAACRIARPRWYRDATALYSPAALSHIRAMGYRIGGFSLNADFGASLPAKAVHARMLAARDGDVIIGHVNQPRRPSGAGIASGAIALRAQGFRFVRLMDVAEQDGWGETLVAKATPS
jgi:peptidoglycan/xylan/chitin deacetylase (PgdA/CDA1 family)